MKLSPVRKEMAPGGPRWLGDMFWNGARTKSLNWENISLKGHLEHKKGFIKNNVTGNITRNANCGLRQAWWPFHSKENTNHLKYGVEHIFKEEINGSYGEGGAIKQWH